MDTFVTGTLPQKRQIEVDATKRKVEERRLENTTVVISILATLSIRNACFLVN